MPVFESPYPGGFQRIIDFRYETPLHLTRSIDAVRTRREHDANYIVAEPYRVTFRVDRSPWSLTVPAGLITDLASVPRWARRVVDRVGPHLEAAIVHDWLYIAWQDLSNGEPLRQDRDFADAVFLAGMKAAKVKKMQQLMIYRTVRAFGWPMYRDRNEERYVEGYA